MESHAPDVPLPLPPAASGDAATPSGAASAGGGGGAVIEYDLACIRCRYNLRALRGDGRCPECGLAVLATLRRDAVLSHSDVAWIESLRRGAYLLAAAIVVWAVPAFVVCQDVDDGFAVATLVPAGPRVWALPFAWATHRTAPVRPLVVPGLAALLLYVAGVWHVTAREPPAAGDDRGGGDSDGGEPALSSRRALRVLAALLPVSAAAWLLVARTAHAWLTPTLLSGETCAACAGALALLDMTVHMLLFARLRWLASRVLDAALVRETRALGWAVTVALLGVAACCLLAGIATADFIPLAVLASGLLMLGGIGVPILMFAFARAFRQSAAAARSGELTRYAAAGAGTPA